MGSRPPGVHVLVHGAGSCPEPPWGASPATSCFCTCSKLHEKLLTRQVWGLGSFLSPCPHVPSHGTAPARLAGTPASSQFLEEDRTAVPLGHPHSTPVTPRGLLQPHSLSLPVHMQELSRAFPHSLGGLFGSGWL